MNITYWKDRPSDAGKIIAWTFNKTIFKTITSQFDHYFEEWLNPTEEELIAFCLEFDIEY